MRLLKLQIEDFRNLESVNIEPHPTLNLFRGENGAGKTSVLESIVVLAKGRSFRTAQTADLIRLGHPQFRIVADLEAEGGATHKLGLEREADRWRARRDGQDVRQIADLAEDLPLVVMEPNSHLLISGPPEGRRKYLDWGVFHVEPDYLTTFRRYSRALKQRNAALRSGQVDTIAALDSQLLQTANSITRAREAYTASLARPFGELVEQIGLGQLPVALSYQKGWSGDSLEAALQAALPRDIERGMTAPGPHRGDLALNVAEISAKRHLSRGEQKTLAAALVLAQACRHVERGVKPLILLDDPASEFDAAHFASVLALSLETGGQIWLTGTACSRPQDEHKMFHVERGKVEELV